MKNYAVPSDWKVVRLKELTVKIKDIDHKMPQKLEKGVPFVSIKYMLKYPEHNFKININDPDLEFISNEDYEYHKKRFNVEKGDIIYSRFGSIGNAKFVKTSEPFIASYSIVLIKPDKQRVDSLFLVYALNSRRVKIQAKIATKGATNRNLHLKDIENLLIPLPPLPEQKAIAKILSTVDEAIQKVDEVIAKAERLKKGLMQKLLTRGIGHKEFRDAEIGKIPKEWEVVRLGDVLELCQYGLSVPLKGEGKYPIVRMDEIVNGYVIPDVAKYVEIDEETFRNFKLERGDVLFNRTNSYELVGSTGIFLLDGDFVFASYLIRLRPKHDVLHPHFLTFYLIFSQSRLRQLATVAVHQANINATNLKNFKIPLPPFPEQQKIAEILSTVDKKLELERKRKEKLERIKKGLMNDLLTGRKRVNVEKILSSSD